MIEVIFCQSKDFREGDIIFLGSSLTAIKIEKKLKDEFLITIFTPNKKESNKLIPNDWFSPIFFSIARLSKL